MILRDGFFQADPHPGNVLINKGGKASKSQLNCRSFKMFATIMLLKLGYSIKYMGSAHIDNMVDHHNTSTSSSSNSSADI